MIMGPFGLNGFILDISGYILFRWLIFHPTAFGLGGVSVRGDVANAIKCKICNGENTKLWHCLLLLLKGLRNGPISYRYEVTVLMETGLPDHALVSDLIKNGYWNLPPNRRMAGQCLMQEIALYELPQLPVEDRIVWSLSPGGH